MGMTTQVEIWVKCFFQNFKIFLRNLKSCEDSLWAHRGKDMLNTALQELCHQHNYFSHVSKKQFDSTTAPGHKAGRHPHMQAWRPPLHEDGLDFPEIRFRAHLAWGFFTPACEVSTDAPF